MENLDSTSIILYNLNDNKVIFSKNPDEADAIASLTKIMTAIITIENHELNETVTITQPMLEGLDEFVIAGLQIGQKLTVEELLYLALLPSDGDAAQALAIHHAGSIANFADTMNKKASELGLTHTHFTNPVGMDDDNYSTAADIATLLKYAIENPTFRQFFSTFSYFSPTLGKTIYKTIDDYNTFTGAKTGFTYAAGRCLASTATIDDVNYLLVNLHADSNSNHHVTDALTIYDYYSTHYSYRTILEQNEPLVDLEVKDSDTKNFTFYAHEPAEAYLANDLDLATLTREYTGQATITNDNHFGELLGTYTISNADEVLYTTDIYLDQEIAFYPYWLWNTGVVAGIVLIIAILIFAIRRRRQQIRKSSTRF